MKFAKRSLVIGVGVVCVSVAGGALGHWLGFAGAPLSLVNGMFVGFGIVHVLEMWEAPLFQ